MYGIIILCAIVGQEPQELYEAHNKIREKYSKPIFTKDPYLHKYANWWAKNMAERRRLQHSPIEKIMKYGYSTVGENIAMGQRTEQEVMRSWMRSRGHRANILNSKFNKIGCGRYKNWWCVVFAHKPK